ncbi:MAG TPA: hypothetical protein VIW03_16105 [Anaeromyxobacter sp.]
MNPLTRYKAAALAVALVALPGTARAEKRVAGAILPEEAEKIGENRFRVPKSYDEVLRFFRSVYGPGKYARRPIADTPSVKAVHIENPEAKPGQWDGLNVYELKNETRIFVLVRPK